MLVPAPADDADDAAEQAEAGAAGELAKPAPTVCIPDPVLVPVHRVPVHILRAAFRQTLQGGPPPFCRGMSGRRRVIKFFCSLAGRR